MEAQMFTQMAVGFVIGMTGINILISFLQLCFEGRRKCSIMEDRKKAAGRRVIAGGRKKYAVLETGRRFA